MELVLGQYFEDSITCNECSKDFADVIFTTDARLMPVRYGKTEPLRLPFSVDEIARDMKSPTFWRGVKPKSLGRLWPRNRFHPVDIIYVNVEGSAWIDSLTEIQIALASRFQTFFGYVHAVQESHARLPEYRARIMPFSQGLAWRDLEKRLPCVAWTMWFGVELVNKIGREKLLASPVFKVAENERGISMQLTKSVDILGEDYETYRAHRDALVNHLGPDIVAPVVRQGT